MTDAIFGWITGKKFCEDPGLQVFINSLCSCGFKGDKVIFTTELTSTMERQLNDKGFIIVWINSNDVHTLYRDRHLAYYNYNISYSYRYILQVDTRDTVFFKNPIDWIETTERLGCLFFVAEGFKYGDSWINCKNQERYQETLPTNFKLNFKTWDVVNGGTVLGTGEMLRWYDLAIWLSGIHANGGDQCALNYVLQLLKNHPDVEILYPNSSKFCLTGEAISIGTITPSNIEDYYLFHQWDRTRYKDEILKKWEKLC